MCRLMTVSREEAVYTLGRDLIVLEDELCAVSMMRLLDHMHALCLAPTRVQSSQHLWPVTQRIVGE